MKKESIESLIDKMPFELAYFERIYNFTIVKKTKIVNNKINIVYIVGYYNEYAQYWYIKHEVKNLYNGLKLIYINKDVQNTIKLLNTGNFIKAVIK